MTFLHALHALNSLPPKALNKAPFLGAAPLRSPGTQWKGQLLLGQDSIGRLGFVVTVVAMPMAMAAASGVGRRIWMEPRWMGKTQLFPVDVLPFLPNHPGIIDMIRYDTI